MEGEDYAGSLAFSIRAGAVPGTKKWGGTSKNPLLQDWIRPSSLQTVNEKITFSKAAFVLELPLHEYL